VRHIERERERELTELFPDIVFTISGTQRNVTALSVAPTFVREPDSHVIGRVLLLEFTRITPTHPKCHLHDSFRGSHLISSTPQSHGCTLFDELLLGKQQMLDPDTGRAFYQMSDYGGETNALLLRLDYLIDSCGYDINHTSTVCVCMYVHVCMCVCVCVCVCICVCM